MKKNIISGIFIALLLTIFVSACDKKDKINTSPSVKLGFSTDTVTFDTVFTSLGTITLDFRIYNPENEALKISSIKLGSGQQSVFTLNVDGEAGNQFQDIEIKGKDSLYVFVKATIDPTDENQPFVIKDSVIFETNTNLQDVKLIAWGQNAHFHNKELLQGQHIWKADKPHIVYDFVVVDDTLNSSLTVEQGAKIYMHHNAIIAVDSSASLKMMGTLEQPISVTSDRLEPFFQHIPGQWQAIWLAAGSVENEIHHTTIRNGIIGVRVDTLGNSSLPTLTLTNSVIENMQAYGLLAQGSYVNVYNSLIDNCLMNDVVLNIGGKYDFRNCTFGNGYGGNNNGMLSLIMNNYYLYEGDTLARPLEKAYFGNCIIYGNNEDEVGLSKTNLAAFEYTFDHSIVKTTWEEDNPRFINCKNEDPLFINPKEFDYHLDSIISPAVQMGSPIIIQQVPNILLYDLDGELRDIQKPDVGVYNFVEKEEDKR